MSLQADPRWIEHRDAYCDAEDRVDGAQERYTRSLPPYMELLAEHCDTGVMRRHMMRQMIHGEEAVPQGIVLEKFGASEGEIAWLLEQGPFA